jgi:hypothetical protein
VGWADVATASDLAALRTELTSVETALRGDIARMQGEMRAEMHSLARSQTWHMMTFVAGFNAVLVAVCSVVVATLV